MYSHPGSANKDDTAAFPIPFQVPSFGIPKSNHTEGNAILNMKSRNTIGQYTLATFVYG